MFFNDTATTEIYTLSLHDALPISHAALAAGFQWVMLYGALGAWLTALASFTVFAPFRATTKCRPDRKSTRLNSSHMSISYAVFCLKKKKINYTLIFISHFLYT